LAAITLGRTPRELEQSMTVRELLELEAFWRIHPWGPLADDLRAARLCATIANFSSSVDWKKRGRRPFAPKDFLPNYEKTQARQTPAQQIQMLKLLPGIDSRKKEIKPAKRKK
jgi:hypothetical protein